MLPGGVDGAIGAHLIGAGDVDGDGLDDLLLSVPGHDGAGPDAGADYVVYASLCALPHPGLRHDDRRRRAWIEAISAIG
ncbi:MAG TPA: hypothetical protein ENK18_19155 [Deltaproteobacteria bacterium]|nr:hypothetical protein [Deltaproteobacteria bacterium]